MVRLKVEQAAELGGLNPEFQFQYGAIKRGLAAQMGISFGGFNSNMVRLKDYIDDIIAVAALLFQFQYGAIKRGGHKTDLTPEKLFQFQYGAIKSAMFII